MKKSILLAFFIAVGMQNLVAQNFEWAKQMGGTSYDGGISITTDSSGNVYTCGFFEGAVDFDPGTGTYNLSSAGSQDVFISKLDASGNLVWAKQMGGIGIDGASSLCVDALGNVYLTGYFEGTADFDPGPGTFNLTSVGNTDAYVAKLDASGSLIWAKQLSGTNHVISRSIVIDASGNVYTTGDFQGTADFDPSTASFNLTSAGATDIFVSKLDASGNLVWAKHWGDVSSDGALSITTDAASNVYTTGSFEGTVDFDPGSGIYNLTSNGNRDIFISKLDASGNLVWAKHWGGTSRDVCHAITIDASGNLYTTGSFEGTVDFDPGSGIYNLTSNGNSDIFISILDASGNLVLAQQFGGTSSEEGFSISLDASGNIYSVGSFQGTADFDPGPSTFNLISAGYQDIYISKLDASGDFVWVKHCGGTGWDEGRSITTDPSGNIYTTGFFSDTADFNPGTASFNLSSAGLLDVFVHKLSQTTSIANNSFSKYIVAYPNPTTGHLTILLGRKYTDISIVVFNAIGQEVLRKSYSSAKEIDLWLEGKIGVYLVEITSGDNKAVVRLIKE
jgi:hypothetical protein